MCCSVLPLITWLLLCPTSDHVTAALSYLWSRDCCSVLPLITWLLLFPTSDHMTAALSYLWSRVCCSVLPLITCLLLCPTSDHVPLLCPTQNDNCDSGVWSIRGSGRTSSDVRGSLNANRLCEFCLSVCLSVSVSVSVSVSLSLFICICLCLSLVKTKWINWSFHLQMISEWM